jgi:hypothetical protein
MVPTGAAGRKLETEDAPAGDATRVELWDGIGRVVAGKAGLLEVGKIGKNTTMRRRQTEG